MFGQPRVERYFAPMRGLALHPGNGRRLELGVGLALFYCVVSILIFNFQHYITRAVDSSEICSNRFLYDTMSWILPKAASHCDLMLTSTLLFHPYKEITVVLDLWFFFVFLAQLVLSFSVSWKPIRNGQNELSRVFREHRKMSISFMLLLSFCIGTIILMVFFSVPLVEEPWDRHPWLNMLGDYYGLGAGLLTLAIGIVSFLISAIGLGAFLAFLQSFSKNIRNQ